MTFEEFDTFQKSLLAEVVHMRDTKGKEYAHSESRFANFDRLSEGLGIPNYKIGWIYCKKHLDSIESYMKEGQTFSNETINSRFVDAITYLTLIAGMVEESRGIKKDEKKDEYDKTVMRPRNHEHALLCQCQECIFIRNSYTGQIGRPQDT